MVLLDFKGYWLCQTRRIANPAGCRGLSGRIRNPSGILPPEIQKSQKNSSEVWLFYNTKTVLHQIFLLHPDIAPKGKVPVFRFAML